MSLLISIVFSILASIGLAFAKATSIYGLIRDRRYSWVNFIAISTLWLGVTIPSAYSMCGQWGCSWGLRFGWISDILPPIFAKDISSGETLLTVGDGHLFGAMHLFLRACHRLVVLCAR